MELQNRWNDQMRQSSPSIFTHLGSAIGICMRILRLKTIEEALNCKLAHRRILYLVTPNQVF